jgi:hypothetical protein
VFQEGFGAHRQWRFVSGHIVRGSPETSGQDKAEVEWLQEFSRFSCKDAPDHRFEMFQWFCVVLGVE